jgi:xylose isomerase
MPLVDLRPQATRRTPDEMLVHLKSFELALKFSAGVWFFLAAAVAFTTATSP